MMFDTWVRLFDTSDVIWHINACPLILVYGHARSWHDYLASSICIRVHSISVAALFRMLWTSAVLPMHLTDPSPQASRHIMRVIRESTIAPSLGKGRAIGPLVSQSLARTTVVVSVGG